MKYYVALPNTIFISSPKNASSTRTPSNTSELLFLKETSAWTLLKFKELPNGHAPQKLKKSSHFWDFVTSINISSTTTQRSPIPCTNSQRETPHSIRH